MLRHHRGRTTGLLREGRPAPPRRLSSAVEAIAEGKRSRGIAHLRRLLASYPWDHRVAHALLLGLWFQAAGAEPERDDREDAWRDIIGIWSFLRENDQFWDWFFKARRPYYPNDATLPVKAVREELDRRIFEFLPERFGNMQELERAAIRLLANGRDAGLLPCGPSYLALTGRLSQARREVTLHAESEAHLLGLSFSDWCWLDLLLDDETRYAALSVLVGRADEAVPLLHNRTLSGPSNQAISILLSFIGGALEGLEQAKLDHLARLASGMPASVGRSLARQLGEEYVRRAFAAHRTASNEDCVTQLLRCKAVDPTRIDLRRHIGPAFANLVNELCEKQELKRAQEQFAEMRRHVGEQTAISRAGLCLASTLLESEQMDSAVTVLRITCTAAPSEATVQNMLQAVRAARRSGFTPVVMANRERAVTCAKEGDWKAAIVYLERALGRCNRWRGQRQLRVNITACRANWAGKLLKNANEAAKRSNWKEANSLIQEAQDIEPTRANRRQLRKIQDSYRKAEINNLANAVVDRVNEIFPKLLPVMHALKSAPPDRPGVALLLRPEAREILTKESRRLKECEADFAKYLKLDPSNPNIRRSLEIVREKLSELAPMLERWGCSRRGLCAP